MRCVRTSSVVLVTVASLISARNPVAQAQVDDRSLNRTHTGSSGGPLRLASRAVSKYSAVDESLRTDNITAEPASPTGTNLISDKDPPTRLALDKSVLPPRGRLGDAALSDQLIKLLWFICAMLVFLMQVGFLLLETGNVCTRSMSGIAIKAFMMLLASSLIYSFIGYRLMYGNTVLDLFGWRTNSNQLSLEWVFYQTGFAAVAATILSGAIAERTTLRSNVIAAIAMAFVVYPVYGHWVWGGGWLSKLFHVYDFAGSSVVHLIGGAAAGIGAFIAGPRRGWTPKDPLLSEDSKSLPLATGGVLFLWLGWMGFNGGSIGIHNEARNIGLYVLATCTAASSGGFAGIAFAAIIKYFYNRRFHPDLTLSDLLRDRLLFDAFALVSGTMGGMVAVTAVCDLLPDYTYAIVPGAVGGVATYLTSIIVRYSLKIDDPVDAVAVHSGAGCAGMLLVPFFLPGTPFWQQMWSQFVGVGAAIVWVLLIMTPVYLLMRGRFDKQNNAYSGFLKCTEEDELEGLSFLPRTMRPPPFPFRTRYLARELRDDIRDFLGATVAGPIHRLKELKALSGNEPGVVRAVDDEITHLTLLGRLGGHKEGAARHNVSDETATQRVSLREVADEVIRDLRGRPEYSGISWDVSPAVGDSYYVRAQHDLLRRAVRALVSNAAEAVTLAKPCTPTVQCSLVHWGTSCRLDVLDNGCGVPRRVQRRLFEPFNTRERRGEGHGLGLFYAEFIAQCFHGSLLLMETTQGEGTRFRLLVPRYEFTPP